MITKAVNLWLGSGPRVVIPLSQFDTAWEFVFTIINAGTEWTIPDSAVAILNGVKPDGNVFSFSGTISNNTVSVNCDVQMTACAGEVKCELSITSSNRVVGTANFILMVEEAPRSPEDVSSGSTLPAYEELLGVAARVPADIPGYISAWLAEHITQPTTPAIDDTLTVEGAAADAKATGDRLAAGFLMTNAAKTALLALLEKVTYTTPDAEDLYDALEAALFPPADLVSITATFTQGSAVIYNTDTLDTLRQYLVVQANYDDMTVETVTTYTLSGTLTAGTSTITATYGGKSDTFTVTVTEYNPLPSDYTRVDYVASLSTGTGSEYLCNTGVTPASPTSAIEVSIGFMATDVSSSEPKYFLSSNEGLTGSQRVGFAVSLTTNGTGVNAINGTSCPIFPNGEGNTMLNTRTDVVATFNPTGTTITDGTLTNTITVAAREHNVPICLFALKNRTDDNQSQLGKGRIYYAVVKEAGTKILDLIPCVRNSDSAAGFYDTVHSSFITNTHLTAPPTT